MSNPYIGEIRMVAFTFAPNGWADCNGQLQAISQNTALFSLLGTTYGGNGQTTFALPDLRGRVPVHTGQGPSLGNRVQGEIGGLEQVSLTTAQLPSHIHPATANVPVTNAVANQTQPDGHRLATANDGESNYSDGAAKGNVEAAVSIGSAGGGQPHENMPPFLTIRFLIAMVGIFPPRS